MICTACPRRCKVERTENAPSKGFCKMPYNAVVARAALHLWEEPPISGKNGSGAIFFSGCSLRCVFCQNREISRDNFGKPVSKARLIEMMQSLEQQGAHNINLVNPTHFVPFLAEVLRAYKPKIPVVYNSGGYDSVESLQMLDGLVDIYLPDFKYIDPATAKRFSAAENYPEIAKQAIVEMRRQTKDRFDENGLMQSGLIVRHLVLPGHAKESVEILKWLSQHLPHDTYISLMSQYTPCGRTYPFHELNRRLTSAEYGKAVDAFWDFGFQNGFMQEKSAATVDFIPQFDLTGV